MTKPVARNWYEAHPLAGGLYRLTECHVDPYAVGDIWLLRGSGRDLVIDAGSGIVSPLSVIRSLSDRPLLAVALNSHYDHAGGWHFFTERACHPLDAAALKTPTCENDQVSAYLTDDSLSALPSDGYSTSDYRMMGAEPTLLLRDGDRIDLGDRSLEVLHLPGRSPGGLALWDSATGGLFTSDMLYDGDHGLAWPPPDPHAYCASLRRIRDLPVTLVYPGHYGQFDAARMRALIDQQLAELSWAKRGHS